MKAFLLLFCIARMYSYEDYYETVARYAFEYSKPHIAIPAKSLTGPWKVAVPI